MKRSEKTVFPVDVDDKLRILAAVKKAWSKLMGVIASKSVALK